VIHKRPDTEQPFNESLAAWAIDSAQLDAPLGHKVSLPSPDLVGNIYDGFYDSAGDEPMVSEAVGNEISQTLYYHQPALPLAERGLGYQDSLSVDVVQPVLHELEVIQLCPNLGGHFK
jgi:hypothetical protein